MTGTEQALAGIAGFSAAQVSMQLSDGPTNASYLLTLAGEQYVLRLDNPGARALRLDRGNEKRVFEAITTAGLAPAPLYSDLTKGILLRPFLPGRSWTVQDLANPGQLCRLARLLRRLHEVTPVGAVFDPVNAARRYARQMEGDDCTQILQRLEELAANITKRSTSPVLCHNDLVCQNILEGDTLSLIDWEYSAVGDRYFDLAVVLQHHGLNDELSLVFLQAYLGRNAKDSELGQLSLQRGFYQCLLELWNRRVEGVR
jgi:thiamine kinase